MSLIMETSRPKLMILPDMVDSSNVDDGDSEMNESTTTTKAETAVNGDVQPEPAKADSDVILPTEPEEILEKTEVKPETPEQAEDASKDKPSDDVEMVDLKPEPAVEDVVVVVPVPLSSEEMDKEVKRLRIDLMKEEMKLSLMKRMFQLQNQPPKVEKREEVAGADRKGQQVKNPTYNLMQHQNGVKNARGQNENLTMSKGDRRDPKNQLKPANSSILRPGTSLTAGGDLSRNLAQKSLGMLKYQQNANSNHYGQHNVTTNQSRNQAGNPSTPQKPQQHPVEALEQQLSAEKALLRRQMEKTVLQIVPPRPPLPDVTFIPSTVCPDFIGLLGMELSASFAIKSRNLIDQAPFKAPYICAKCGEDVCPYWKVDQDTGVVVCESCYLTSRSAVTRSLHIDNLRKAFAEIIEKEHDLDRQHTVALEKARTSSPVKFAGKVPLAPAFPSNVTVRSQVAAVVNNHHNSSGMQHHLTSSRVTKSQQHLNNNSQSSAHSSLRSNLPPAPSSRSISSKAPMSSPFAPMSAPLPFAPTSAAGRHSSFGNNSVHGRQQSADVQRQYLLDMISRGPKQQANGPWRKTSG